MEDERVLLTGASSGIGRALALKLAARGARLALTARREERLRGLADEIVRAGGAPPAVLAADLATAGAAAELASHALEELGGVDVLVNNAGGALHGQVWAAGDCDAARELLEVNYWSPLALIHAL